MTRAIAFLALVPALALAACNAPTQAEKETPARPVLVVEAHYAPRATQRVLPGIVKARYESDLAFRVAGKIAKRLVDAGAMVKRGDALALLDDSDLRLQVEQAEAEQASAKSALEQADAELQRVDTLHRQGWSASADADKVKAAADQARGNLIKAERAVTLARNALGYATLTADADGIVSAVNAEAGQVVAAGAPVMRLAQNGEREAAVALPETLVDLARVEPARTEVWALPGLSLKAILREIAPAADSATRTYPARFSLPEAPAALQLGMSVTIALQQDGAKVAKLPLGALFDEGKGPQVWIVKSGAGDLTAAPVEVAGYDGDSAYVSGGVAEGASVVALGAHKLDAAAKVRVVQNLAGM
jgi:RND family efflux transporter MFP subunit